MSNVGNNVQRLANLAGAATGAQTGVNFQLGPKDSGTVHVDASGAVTVAIEGRLDPAGTYRPIGVQLPDGTFAASITASGMYRLVNTAPDMRANVTVNAGTVVVWVKA